MKDLQLHPDTMSIVGGGQYFKYRLFLIVVFIISLAKWHHHVS